MSSSPKTLDETWGVFRKSRFSASGDCVEVAFLKPAGVLVRNSRRPDAEVLEFTGSEWTAFLRGVGAGEFDHPELLRVNSLRPAPGTA